jgi:hypothetical protein
MATGVSETRTWDAVLTSTMANYRETMIDNIFDDLPLLSYMNGKLGIALRGNSAKRTLSGGESIVEHLLFEQNSAVNSYSGAGVLDTTLQDGMTIARYNWKQYAVPVGITGLEKRNNQGEEAMINLLQAKMEQSTMTIKDRLNVDAFGDGTGNSSKNILGLEAIISTTASLGGIDPSTYGWWQSKVATSAGSFAAGGVDAMRTKFNDLTLGSNKPDLMLTTQAIFEYFEKSLQPQARYTDTSTLNAGFQNLVFKGVPVVFDRACTSGVMYFLNSKYLNWVVHRDADMSVGPFVTPNNQDVSTSQILFQGNMTTNNRRLLGKISGITA